MKTLEIIYWLRLALGITAALLCIGYSLAMGAIHTNLVLNSSLEVGEATPDNWVSSGIATEWSTSDARTGLRSIRINVVDANAEWKGKVESVREGSNYEAHGFFKGELIADNCSLTIRWFSDPERLNLVIEDSIPIQIGNYTEWARKGNVFTAPNTAKSCEIVFIAINASGDIYGDDFEFRQTGSFTILLNGLSLALVTYLISYYIIRSKFSLNVEKPQKLLTTGIGIYFLSWLIFWVLLYTIITG